MSSLTLTDVLDVEYPGSPAWSADGRFLATALYEDDGQTLLIADTTRADEENVHAHCLPADDSHVVDFAWASTPVQATQTSESSQTTQTAESLSSELVVTTDAGETLLFDASDESIRRRSMMVGGETAPTWSSDGSRIACYRDSRPSVYEISSGVVNTFDVPTNDRFLSESRMFAWSDARLAFRFTDQGTKQIGVLDVDSGKLIWRTSGTASHRSPVWLADGRVVIDQIDDGGTVRRIIAIDPASGERTVLYEKIDREAGIVSQGAPTVSPDGRWLALSLPDDGWDHVHAIDTNTGERRQLTDGPFEDSGVADSVPQWVDETTVVFASNRRDPGQRQILTVDLAGNTTPVVESSGTNVHPVPSPDGRRLAYIHADQKRSPELRVVPLHISDDERDDTLSDNNDGNVHRFTRSSVDSWPVDPIEPEHVTFESSDERKIHGYLIDPREASVDDDATSLPGVVWVHGGPMRQMRDGWHPSRSYGLPYTFHQYLAHRGYVCLLVNYRGGIGYGKEFRQALVDGYGRDEMNDIVAGADFLKDLSYTDPEAVGIWGLSYGGYATLQILGTHPDTFTVGVNIAGLADIQHHQEWARETKYSPSEYTKEIELDGDPWEAPEAWNDASPVTHVENYDAPVYNFHGMADRYVSVEQQNIVVDRLLELDKPFEAEYYPDETHVFSKRTTWKRTFRKIEDAWGTLL
jgi:dipeptidyl aminopeptidase/acylaminoacyl peptidase